MYNVVLVAVMVVQNSGAIQVDYQSVEYYNSFSKCRQEMKKLSQTKDKRVEYVCVKVDRD